MSFTKKVQHYLDICQEKEIINATQKKDILATIKSESSFMGFFKILSVIGVICIGIGVILIIASNWSDFPRLLQLLLALLLPIVSLGVGYFFSYIQKELKILGSAFLLLGAILIGATITLIGQIYNLDGTVGSLLLMWFTLSLPLVFIFRLKTLAVLSTGLFYSVCLYYFTEVFFESWLEEEYILASFATLSGLVTVGSYLFNDYSKKAYSYLFLPVSIISLKILFLTLFLSTLDESMMFLGETFFAVVAHNLLFLGVVGFIMWWANKNHEILLRHATFIWIGLYMIVKYFELFSGYLQAGVFFIITGVFLIGLVYSFIKINNYLEKNTRS